MPELATSKLGSASLESKERVSCLAGDPREANGCSRNLHLGRFFVVVVYVPRLGRRGVSFRSLWNREREERARACFLLGLKELRKRGHGGLPEGASKRVSRARWLSVRLRSCVSPGAPRSEGTACPPVGAWGLGAGRGAGHQ